MVLNLGSKSGALFILNNFIRKNTGVEGAEPPYLANGMSQKQSPKAAIGGERSGRKTPIAIREPKRVRKRSADHDEPTVVGRRLKKQSLGH